MATLPNMWQRTLTVGSAGKTFSATGLKIGWTIGPSNLIRSCQIVHQVNRIRRIFFEKRLFSISIAFISVRLCLKKSLHDVLNTNRLD